MKVSLIFAAFLLCIFVTDAEEEIASCSKRSIGNPPASGNLSSGLGFNTNYVTLGKQTA